MKYNSASDPLNFDFNFAMGPMVITAKDLIADAAYNGKLSEDYVQLLPKFALQYEWKKAITFTLQYPRVTVREAITSKCFLI